MQLSKMATNRAVEYFLFRSNEEGDSTGTDMSAPLVVVNFKTYASASGRRADALAAHMASINTNARLVAAVSAFDLSSVAAISGVEVWSQHLDGVSQGSATGWLEINTAIERGAAGTLINHAEHKVSIEDVKKLLDMLPEGMPVCACAADVDEARALAALGPTFIAVEPPELIGVDISVTSADPAIVKDTVAAVKEVNPDVRILCGAGVKNGADVTAAIALGAEGVLLASGVTKAEDARAVLEDLVSGL